MANLKKRTHPALKLLGVDVEELLARHDFHIRNGADDKCWANPNEALALTFLGAKSKQRNEMNNKYIYEFDFEGRIFINSSFYERSH